MKKLAMVIAVMIMLGGCDDIKTAVLGKDPKQIVFGLDPKKDLEDQKDILAKLSEEDRALLFKALMYNEMGKAFGNENQFTGLTAAEVIEMMKKKESRETAEAIAAEKLRQEAKKEREAIAEKIAKSVTVAVVNKTVYPKDIHAGRFDEQLQLEFAVQNMASKTIVQIKGTIIFADLVGDKIGGLSVNFDEIIKPGESLNTDTGLVWRVSRIGYDAEEKIADKELNQMKTRFQAEAIAFEDGEVIKANGK